MNGWMVRFYGILNKKPSSR